MNEQELSQEIQIIDDELKSIVISNQAEYENAAGHVARLETLIKKIKEYWKEPKEKAHQAHKAITQKETEMLRPIEARKTTLRQKISAFLTEQDRKRREEQARLDKEREEKERKERERLERQAQKAEDKGQLSKADELREKADDFFVAPVIAKQEIEKTTRTDDATISQKKDIEITITDVKEICRQIGSGILPDTVVSINVPKLKQFIKLSKIEHVGGCIIKEIVNTQIRVKGA